MFKPRFGVRGRILTIALVPSIALLVGGTIVTVDLQNQADRAQQWSADMGKGLSAALGFTNPMAYERLLSEERLAGMPVAPDDLARARAQVDSGLRGMILILPGMRSVSSDFKEKSAALLGTLAGQLPVVRKQVDTGAVTPMDAYLYYSQFLNFVLAGDQALERTVPDGGAAVDMAMSDRLLDADEALGRSAALGVVLQAHPALFRNYVREVGAYHADLDQISSVLPTDLQSQVHALTSSRAWQHLAAVEDTLIRRGPNADGGDSDGTNPADWLADSQDSYRQLYGMALADAYHAIDSEKATGDRLANSAVVAGIIIIGLAALVLALGVLQSAALIRRLRRLRRETLELADDRLPRLMAKLQTGGEIDAETDVAVLDFGADEIGEIANAFNHAHSAAVGAAVTEANTREGVRAVFLNIAHRSQIVVHRQLEILDLAERQAEEPGQLDMLFRLDHLATRERRNAENLVILGGEQPGRRWRVPVPLVELVRSAVAETEEYTKVNVTRIPELSILGDAVADLVHLMAELVDNATSFSPPESRVEVSGTVVGRGVVVEIVDQGLGMTESEMSRVNDTMLHPPDFSVIALSSDSRLGLFVVARLAMRTGVAVRFVESDYGGVRVIVRIPVSLTVEQPAPAERSDQFRQRVRLPGEVREDATAAARHPVPVARSSSRLAAPPSADPPPGDSELPPLPRRGRGTHLAPQLLESRAAAPIPRIPRQRSSDEARDVWSAIAEGTMAGRDDHTDTSAWPDGESTPS